MWKGSSTRKSHRVGDRDGIWLCAWVISISDRAMGQDISAHSLRCVLSLPESHRSLPRSAASFSHLPVMCSTEVSKNTSIHVLHCCHPWLQALRSKSAVPPQRQILNRGVWHCVLEIKIPPVMERSTVTQWFFAIVNFLPFLHQAHTKAVVWMKAWVTDAWKCNVAWVVWGDYWSRGGSECASSSMRGYFSLVKTFWSLSVLIHWLLKMTVYHL